MTKKMKWKRMIMMKKNKWKRRGRCERNDQKWDEFEMNVLIVKLSSKFDDDSSQCMEDDYQIK
jgi:hypothetical protein